MPFPNDDDETLACCPVVKEGARDPIRFIVTDVSDKKACQGSAHVKVEAWWKDGAHNGKKCTCECCEVRQYAAVIDTRAILDEIYDNRRWDYLTLVQKSKLPKGTSPPHEYFPEGSPFHVSGSPFEPLAANEDPFAIWLDSEGNAWREDLALGQAYTQPSNFDPEHMKRAAEDPKYRADFAERLKTNAVGKRGKLTEYTVHKFRDGSVVTEGTKGLCEWEHEDNPTGGGCRLPDGFKRVLHAHRLALMVVIRPQGLRGRGGRQEVRHPVCLSQNARRWLHACDCC